MSKPLALLCYQNLLPGSQLTNRLQDIGYRVLTLRDVSTLTLICEREKPLVILAEILAQSGGCQTVAALKKNPATHHVPVLAFSVDHISPAEARQAGIALLASSGAVLEQLPKLLDQVLQIE